MSLFQNPVGFETALDIKKPHPRAKRGRGVLPANWKK
jgi:hypothetical protein